MSLSKPPFRSHSFIVSCWGTSLAPVVRTGFLEEVALNIGWVWICLGKRKRQAELPASGGGGAQPGSYCPHCLGCAGTGRKKPLPAAGAVKAEGKMRGSPRDSGGGHPPQHPPPPPSQTIRQEVKAWSLLGHSHTSFSSLSLYFPPPAMGCVRSCSPVFHQWKEFLPGVSGRPLSSPRSSSLGMPSFLHAARL